MQYTIHFVSDRKPNDDNEERHEERDHDAMRIVAIVVVVALVVAFTAPLIFAGL